MYGAINMLAKCRCDWFNFQWWCRQFIAIVMKMMVAQKSNRRLLLFPIFGGNTGTGVGWCWRWHRCCENKINSNRAKRGEKERNENECRNYVICDTHTHGGNGNDDGNRICTPAAHSLNRMQTNNFVRKIMRLLCYLSSKLLFHQKPWTCCVRI